MSPALRVSSVVVFCATWSRIVLRLLLWGAIPSFVLSRVCVQPPFFLCSKHRQLVWLEQ